MSEALDEIYEMVRPGRTDSARAKRTMSAKSLSAFRSVLRKAYERGRDNQHIAQAPVTLPRVKWLERPDP